MNGQIYYDVRGLTGETINTLLLKLKDLIESYKITNFLPENTNKEINAIKIKIDELIEEIETIDFTEGIDGGEYSEKKVE